MTTNFLEWANNEITSPHGLKFGHHIKVLMRKVLKVPNYKNRAWTGHDCPPLAWGIENTALDRVVRLGCKFDTKYLQICQVNRNLVAF